MKASGPSFYRERIEQRNDMLLHWQILFWDKLSYYVDLHQGAVTVPSTRKNQDMRQYIYTDTDNEGKLLVDDLVFIQEGEEGVKRLIDKKS